MRMVRLKDFVRQHLAEAPEGAAEGKIYFAGPCKPPFGHEQANLELEVLSIKSLTLKAVST